MSDLLTISACVPGLPTWLTIFTVGISILVLDSLPGHCCNEEGAREQVAESRLGPPIAHKERERRGRRHRRACSRRVSTDDLGHGSASKTRLSTYPRLAVLTRKCQRRLGPMAQFFVRFSYEEGGIP